MLWPLFLAYSLRDPIQERTVGAARVRRHGKETTLPVGEAGAEHQDQRD